MLSGPHHHYHHYITVFQTFRPNAEQVIVLQIYNADLDQKRLEADHKYHKYPCPRGPLGCSHAQHPVNHPVNCFPGPLLPLFFVRYTPKTPVFGDLLRSTPTFTLLV